MEKETYPIIQTITPTRAKSKETKAKGNPIKKPNGLHSQSPIIPTLSLSFLQIFFSFSFLMNPRDLFGK
jgi:hypothetical protein